PTPPLQPFPTRRSSDLLQRIHVAKLLAALQQRDGEVGHPRRPHFALLDEPHHRLPRILHGRSRLVGPMKLVEVDALDSEAAQRRDRKSTRLNSSHVSIS